MRWIVILVPVLLFALSPRPSASEITELQPVGSLHFASECMGLEVKDDLIYVATGWGLEVYQARDGRRPVKIGEVPTPGSAHDVAVKGNYAFVADRDRLTVIDVTDPREMKLVSVTPVKAWTWEVAVKDDIVFTRFCDGVYYSFLSLIHI